MFFTWAVHTKHRWLQKVIYWAQVPIVVGLAYGAARLLNAVARGWLSALESASVRTSLTVVWFILLYLGAASLCAVLLDKLFRYRPGDLLLASLNFCPEDVCAPHLNLRRGTLVVELHMGEFYNFAKYWPLRLQPSELVPFVFLDTYKGVLNLIEQVKAGTAPIDGTTPLMSTTIFLRAASHIPLVYEAEEIKRTKSFLYRLTMALSLRMSPFSSRLPAPRSGSKRVYMPTQALVDYEPFFREEVARLSQLTQKILERKNRQPVNQREPRER